MPEPLVVLGGGDGRPDLGVPTISTSDSSFRELGDGEGCEDSGDGEEEPPDEVVCGVVSALLGTSFLFSIDTIRALAILIT